MARWDHTAGGDVVASTARVWAPWADASQSPRPIMFRVIALMLLALLVGTAPAGAGTPEAPEGTGSLATRLQCAQPGDTIAEEHNVIGRRSGKPAYTTTSTPEQAVTGWLAQPDSPEVNAASLRKTFQAADAATFEVLSGMRSQLIVDLFRDPVTGVWLVDGWSACEETYEPGEVTAFASARIRWRSFYSSLHPRAYQGVEYFFERGFPRGRRRARVVDAGRAWSAAPGALVFRANRGRTLAPEQCPRRATGPRQATGIVGWRRIDGPSGVNRPSTLARSGTCWETNFDGTSMGIAFAFNVTADRSERWFFRSARGTPSLAQFDLRGVMTHEFGHALGHMVHFDDRNRGTSVCRRSNPRRATLCSMTDSGRRGAWMRSLESYDRRTFRDAYRSPLVRAMRTLTVERSGTGRGIVRSTRPAGISCGGDCTTRQRNGTEVRLRAVPGDESRFDSWSGDVVCMGGNARRDCRFFLQGANRRITARFEAR